MFLATVEKYFNLNKKFWEELIPGTPVFDVRIET
jgi:hypothetical protein